VCYASRQLRKHEEHYPTHDLELAAMVVTPTFCKNKNFCANRSAYKNSYQIKVLVKNFPKINLA
jgi:hypothetical protein